MTDVGDFPGGMPSYYRVHLEWVRHATETAADADPDIDGPDHIGPTIIAFDAKFDPIGQRIREVLEPTFLIETPEGLLSLTDRGLAELATDYGTKADSTFGNVSITGTLVVNGAVTFSSTGSFAGPVTFPTNAVTGINPGGLDGILIDGPAASGAGISGRKLGLNRWRLVLGNNAAESGLNAGSDFFVTSYADNGTTIIGSPLIIQRANGAAFFGGGYLYVSANGATASAEVPAPNHAVLRMNKVGAVGSVAIISGRREGLERWHIQLGDGAAESTGNAGSNFVVSRYTDAGGLIDSPLTINRASGQATFLQTIIAANGNVTLSGAANAAIYMIKQAGANGNYISGFTGANVRWQMVLGDSTAESTGNAGSNFGLSRFTDAGGFLDTPLSINRATGQITINAPAGLIAANVTRIDGPAGVQRAILATTAGVGRWALVLANPTAEGGSNAGSDLVINRYSDAGAVIDAAFQINRASALITTSGSLTVNGNLATNQINAGNIIASQNLQCNVGAASATLYLQNSTRSWLIFNNNGDGTLHLWDNTGAASRLNIQTSGLVTVPGALTVSGLLTANGSATVNVTNQSFNITGSAGQFRQMMFQSGAQGRWLTQITNGAESGSNAGSDYGFFAMSDGAVANPVYSVVRSTQIVSFTKAIVNGPSDRTLKQDIAPLTGSLAKVLQLKGVSFAMIDDETKRRQIGFVAQDVAPIVPEVLQEYRPDPEQDPKLALDYPKLTALLVEALKEVTARLEAVEAKLPAAA